MTLRPSVPWRKRGMLPATMLLACLALAGGWMARVALAQALPPAAAREIEQLFSALESSGCDFQRNGAWHGAAKASSHLRRKYDYLLKKNAVGSAESFIELAASRSSMSGKPYQVRCNDDAAVSSEAWFKGKLAEVRKGAAAP